MSVCTFGFLILAYVGTISAIYSTAALSNISSHFASYPVYGVYGFECSPAMGYAKTIAR